jgi:peptidoglycan pentaglycine glycine transferase (the fourth and fifth glycine)
MKFKGQYFLNNEMIKYAIDNGYEKYNFYGITGDFTEDSPMYGLFDFKRGFGANVEELIGEFTYITNNFYFHIYNGMFAVYKKLKKVLK